MTPRAEAEPMSVTRSANGHPVERGKLLTQPKDRARQLYEDTCQRSWWEVVQSIFGGGVPHLLDLERFFATCTVVSCQDLGIRSVPIAQIRGSVSSRRAYDFDANFRPIKTHVEERWLSLATACQRGVKIPPVILVQIGGIYFVQDGHHRISVARAMGQTEIVATVTVWQVTGMLPWKEQEARGNTPAPALKAEAVQSSPAS
jgi:hypothetical protein